MNTVVIPVTHTISFCYGKPENENLLFFKALISISNVLYMLMC